SFSVVVQRDGRTFNLRCTEEIAKMLVSKTVDPSVKELLISGLLESQFPKCNEPVSHATEANSDENYNNNEKALKDTNEPIKAKGDIQESPSTSGTKGISQDGTSEQNIDDPNISQAIHTWKGN
ncbi:hypothetical protein ACJMK2_044283, partial [Sinanodonta woodiana]